MGLGTTSLHIPRTPLSHPPNRHVLPYNLAYNILSSSSLDGGAWYIALVLLLTNLAGQHFSTIEQRDS